MAIAGAKLDHLTGRMQYCAVRKGMAATKINGQNE
jgi:hypothetical protein